MTIRLHALAALALAASVAAAAAQTSEPAKSDKKTIKPKSVTLIGCVDTDDTAPGQLTFADAKDGTVYRLSGTDARQYVGHRVQVSGAPHPNRVKVRIGLLPSPNVAGQAGAIDPARAAIAEQGADRGTGTVELPEFSVTTVKPVNGKCPPEKK